MSEIERVKVTVFPDGRLDSVNAGLYLGLSPKTLAMMRSMGTGPKFVKRGRIFYFLEDLRAWMEDQPRVRSTGEARALSNLNRPANDH
ncbi:MAG: hypothetical protein RJS98_10815 [Rhodospirillaceae bacterium]